MKLLQVIPFLAVATASLHAGSYSFTPTPRADLYDLDHYFAYSWGVNATGARTDLLNGMRITGATLTIANIRNWDNNPNILHINLLDGVFEGIRSVQDNTTDAFSASANFFATTPRTTGNIQYSDSFALTSWSDTLVGGTPEQFSFAFSSTAGALGKLETFILNDVNGNAGLGFDPDCHYWNDGVQLTITTARVPDAGSSALLLGSALAALTLISHRGGRRRG